MAEFFILYDTYWANSPDRFSGPFPSRAAAFQYLEGVGGEIVMKGQSPRNIRDAFRILGVLPASEVPLGEFRRFVHRCYSGSGDPEVWERFAPLTFDAGRIQSRRLGKLMH